MEQNLEQDHTQPSGGGSSTYIYDCPSLLLKPFAIGPFDPKKPLLQFVTNNDKGKKVEGGGRNWSCHFCSTSFSGSYTRVVAHLTYRQGSGVRVCKNMNNFQFAEAFRLQQTTLHTQGDPILSRTSRSSPSPTAHASSSCMQPCSSTFPNPTLPPSRKRGNITDALNIQAKEVVDDSMCNFFFSLGLPFHIARSFHYKDVFEKVREARPSYVLPS